MSSRGLREDVSFFFSLVLPSTFLRLPSSLLLTRSLSPLFIQVLSKDDSHQAQRTSSSSSPSRARGFDGSWTTCCRLHSSISCGPCSSTILDFQPPPPTLLLARTILPPKPQPSHSSLPPLPLLLRSRSSSLLYPTSRSTFPVLASIRQPRWRRIQRVSRRRRLSARQHSNASPTPFFVFGFPGTLRSRTSRMGRRKWTRWFSWNRRTRWWTKRISSHLSRSRRRRARATETRGVEDRLGYRRS